MTLNLIDDINGRDRHHLWAHINESGDLVISGQDLGPKVEQIFGDSDYEWAHTIPNSHLPEFLELLGGSPGVAPLTVLESYVGQRSYELSALIQKARETMPITFWSWS